MERMKIILLLIGLITLRSLMDGCASPTNSFEPKPADEMAGPGLFSGEDGRFTLYRSRPGQEEDEPR